MPLLCRLGWHRWRVVKDTDKHLYDECQRCHERRVRDTQPGVGYQPIDQQWLAGGDFFDPLQQPLGLHRVPLERPLYTTFMANPPGIVRASAAYRPPSVR